MEEQKGIQASPELAVFMEYHHLLTVALLLKIDDEALLQMDGFGWRLMKEVLQLRKV
jgi:hypothetical protein